MLCTHVLIILLMVKTWNVNVIFYIEEIIFVSFHLYKGLVHSSIVRSFPLRNSDFEPFTLSWFLLLSSKKCWKKKIWKIYLTLLPFFNLPPSAYSSVANRAHAFRSNLHEFATMNFVHWNKKWKGFSLTIHWSHAELLLHQGKLLAFFSIRYLFLTSTQILSVSSFTPTQLWQLKIDVMSRRLLSLLFHISAYNSE